MSTEYSQVSAIERGTMRKVAWRLLPFLTLCYVIAIIDRGNIGMASLQMNEDLGLTATAFGLPVAYFSLHIFYLKYPATSPCKNLEQKFGLLELW